MKITLFLHQAQGSGSIWFSQFMRQIVCLSVLFSWIHNRTQRSTPAVIRLSGPDQVAPAASCRAAMKHRRHLDRDAMLSMRGGRGLSAAAIVAVLALVTGCTWQQAYSSAQMWQRNACDRRVDQYERERCLANTTTSYDDYQRRSTTGSAKTSAD